MSYWQGYGLPANAAFINMKHQWFFHNQEIDLAKHIATKNNEIIKLTSTEFSLLALLAKNESRVLNHVYILQEVWGYGYTKQTQYLKVFIAHLSKKIENDPSKPKLLITKSGIG